MPAPLVGKNNMKVKKNRKSVYLKDFCSSTCRVESTPRKLEGQVKCSKSLFFFF